MHQNFKSSFHDKTTLDHKYIFFLIIKVFFFLKKKYDF